MLNGAIAGVAARTASAPIDLLKIRFQLQSPTRRHYSSILGSVKTILCEEGLPVKSPSLRSFNMQGFWKGNMAGLYLYASYSAVQFGIYEELAHRFHQVPELLHS